MNKYDYDYIVVGSGFGGSVSAMRLSQKGYKVLVIESGKRWKSEDFPKTNFSLAKYVWFPKIFFYGIQRINLLNDVMILSGAGVGGGNDVQRLFENCRSLKGNDCTFEWRKCRANSN